MPRLLQAGGPPTALRSRRIYGESAFARRRYRDDQRPRPSQILRSWSPGPQKARSLDAEQRRVGPISWIGRFERPAESRARRCPCARRTILIAVRAWRHRQVGLQSWIALQAVHADVVDDANDLPPRRPVSSGHPCLTRAPIGSLVPKKRRANVSLTTTTTPAPVRRSRLSNQRSFDQPHAHRFEVFVADRNPRRARQLLSWRDRLALDGEDRVPVGAQHGHGIGEGGAASRLGIAPNALERLIEEDTSRFSSS